MKFIAQESLSVNLKKIDVFSIKNISRITLNHVSRKKLINHCILYLKIYIYSLNHIKDSFILIKPHVVIGNRHGLEYDRLGIFKE